MSQNSGTTPPGTSTEQQAARWVQQMFAGIAPKYDFLNHLLSFNIDRRWRKVLVKRLTHVLQRPEASVLDLCCGTGDVLLDLKAVAECRVFGADFCHPMLVSAAEKAHTAGFRAALFEGDALVLPVRDNSFSAIVIAFGFRNLANYTQALREFHRVLEPGGTLAILEFSHPNGVLTKAAYGAYSRLLLPAVGTLISGSAAAYTYLPDSIRKFPRAIQLAEMLTEAAFSEARFELLSDGIAALHTAEKLPDSSAG